MNICIFCYKPCVYKKKQYLRPTPRHKEFYVLGVRDSSHSRAALIPHTCHRQLFGAALFAS